MGTNRENDYHSDQNIYIMPAKKERYIFKDTPDKFVAFDVDLLIDGTLTNNEVLVLLVLLSLPDTWRIRKSQIQDQLQWSKVKLNTAWDGLEEKKYITKKGMDRNTFWSVYQSPIK